MTVRLDSKKTRGKNITKTVTVFSNDPENPEYTLSIKGSILEILETRPLTLKLQGLAGNGLSGSFSFSAGSPLDVEILEVKGQPSQSVKLPRSVREENGNCRSLPDRISGRR